MFQLNADGETILQYACTQNASQAIRVIIQQCPFLVSYPRDPGALRQLEHEQRRWRVVTGGQMERAPPLVTLWIARNKKCIYLLMEAG